MRSSKIPVIFLALIVVVGVASAENKLGTRDVSHVTFVAPIRVGDTLLPAGDYLMRPIMEGENHIMVFESVKTKTVEVKAHCKLVPLTEKATQSSTIYNLNAANERVLQELVFRGDTAKHFV